jgi:hypothetical protein
LAVAAAGTGALAEFAAELEALAAAAEAVSWALASGEVNKRSATWLVLGGRNCKSSCMRVKPKAVTSSRGGRTVSSWSSAAHSATTGRASNASIKSPPEILPRMFSAQRLWRNWL